jgi:two-component system chemotaxis response regulator CheY
MEATNQAKPSRPTVLVIDDSNLCRELVVEALRGHGYATVSAADGELGLECLEMGHVDAVILDSEMPNLDGLGFLKSVRADTRWEQLPVVMLTTNVSRELISEAMSRKISGFLLKSRFSMPEMLARVHTAILRGRSAAGATAEAPVATQPAPAAKAAPTAKPPAAAAAQAVKIPNLISRDNTLAAMADFKSIKPLAGSVAQIAAIAATPRPTPAEMAAVVRQDPVLAARVIHLAATNSAAARSQRLANVDDAVRSVGVEAVRDLAAAMGGMCGFPEAPADGMGMLRCWPHALAAAVVMSQIVPKSESVPSGLPYLIGLCHDLAEIVLRQRFPNEFAAALDFASQTAVPVSAVVIAVFGVSYAEITEALFQNLKFPPLVAGPIIEYAVNAGKTVEAHKGVLARSLAISDFIVHGMLLASSGDALIAPISQAACRSMLIPTSALNFVEIHSEAVTSICLLAKLSAEDEALFLKPLVHRSDAGICYARHPNFAAMDPIFVALASLGSAHIQDRQNVSDPVSLQRLVVLSPGANLPFMHDAARACMQSGKKVPTLHIMPSMDQRAASDAPAGVTEIAHPLSIDQLAEFISGLKRSK